MQNLVPLVFFHAVLVVVIGGSLVLSRWQAKKARANLVALADALGLQLNERPPVLGLFPVVPTASGRRDGRTVRLHTFTTGSGKRRQVWQALGVSCENAQGLTFVLGPQNVLTALGTLFGGQDVRVGDPAFDDRFVVRTNAVDFLRAALLPEIRALLLQRWSARGAGATVKLEGGEVVYAETGSFTETAVVERMKGMLEPLYTLAALPEVYRR